jgi:hypothetical protein
MNARQERARELAGVILRVRSGQITATEGARMLGISRKTYYQWEKKALLGMMSQLEQQPPGRPETTTNPEMEAMRRKIARLEKELEVAEQTAEVRAILMDMRTLQEKRAFKKKKPK